MALRIKAAFTQQQFQSYLQQQVGKIEEAILLRLQYVGEAFVRNARNNNTYKDQTGNLRSSIGYIIVKNSAIVHSNFKKSSSGSNREAGLSRGQQYADEIAAEHPQGFILICVAGMQYAAIVESRGYDVISNASINAKQDLEKALNKLAQKISR